MDSETFLAWPTHQLFSALAMREYSERSISEIERFLGAFSYMGPSGAEVEGELALSDNCPAKYGCT